MLARPDIRPDARDNQGRTPLWHALGCLREECRAFTSGLGHSDGGRFRGFLTASIGALCARDDVDPHSKCPARERQSPADVAAEVLRICNGEEEEIRGSGSSVGDEDADDETTAAGGARLSPAVALDTTGVVVVKKKRRRRRKAKREAPGVGGEDGSTGSTSVPEDASDGERNMALVDEGTETVASSTASDP